MSRMPMNISNILKVASVFEFSCPYPNLNAVLTNSAPTLDTEIERIAK